MPFVKEKSLRKKISKAQKKRIMGAKLQLPDELKAGDRCSFESLRDLISEATMKSIEEIGFSTMTEIQAKAIPKLLEGRDLRATAKTGSGKTLAFLIPVIELLVKLRFKYRNGTGAIIISPTRELSMQTYGVLRELMRHHSQTFGLIMGGTNVKNEAQKLSKGVNILIATPGRLLHHLKSSASFHYQNLACLVVDEADRSLELGFLDEMKQIAKLLPVDRQTMLFSATKDERTLNLSRTLLGSDPAEVDVHADKQEATADGLEQSYVVVPGDKRFLVLYHFLKRHHRKKIMVFFNSVAPVLFYSSLLNYINVPVLSIHGKLTQEQRANNFHAFCNKDSGTLLCTNIAARGWDIPAVDWIVQYDPPDDPREYIHRVGRTARAGGKGQALLFLLESEKSFIRFLGLNKVKLDLMDISYDKIKDVRDELQDVVMPNGYLRALARDAFQSYLRAYDGHSLKGIFDVEKLDREQIAKSFCLKKAPFVSLMKPRSQRRSEKRPANFGNQSSDTSKRKIFDE